MRCASNDRGDRSGGQTGNVVDESCDEDGAGNVIQRGLADEADAAVHVSDIAIAGDDSTVDGVADSGYLIVNNNTATDELGRNKWGYVGADVGSLVRRNACA